MDLKLNMGCEMPYCADLSVLCGDLETGNEIVTAAIICLFTNRRARDDDTLPDPGSHDKRGWWGSELLGFDFGSRLWLLERSRNTRQAVLSARDYCKEALQTLVDFKICNKFSVDVDAHCPDTLALHITLYEPCGKVQGWQFQYAWRISKLESCAPIPNHC